MRTVRVAAAALLAAVLSVGGCLALRGAATGRVDITPAELQARVAPKFPVRDCRLRLACVELADPRVLLADGSDRIGLAMTLAIDVGASRSTGSLSLSGRPRYVPAEARLFLDDLAIDDLRLGGLPPGLAGLLRERVPDLLRPVLQAQPIWTIDDESAKAALLRRTLRSVTVVDGRLRLQFGEVGRGD